MSYKSDYTTLISYIQKTIWDISDPLNECLEMVANEQGRKPIQDAYSLIVGEISIIALNACKVDNAVELEVVTLIQTLRETFAPVENGSFIFYQNLISNWIVEEQFFKPGTVELLEQYDQLSGTSHAPIAKTMFFRLVTAIVKADNFVSDKETYYLDTFHSLLFDTASKKLDTPEVSKAQQVITAVQPGNTDDLDGLISSLNELVGLDNVKSDVLDLVNFLKVQQMRQSKGMTSVPISRHLVFYGNPGTGKTTVARLLAKIYKSLGIISKGHLVETDRSGLVAGYIGQTAIKVRETIKSAQGGVLFIDEAYALVSDGQDYGQEAIETLIKFMEDYRDDLIVVVAGYTEKMGKFLSTNPGLKSRFSKYLNFEDYSPEQLTEIFQLFCNNSSFETSNNAKAKIYGVFQILHNSRDETFGNARLARNVFERIVNNQANRVIRLSNISDQVLSTIEEVDIPSPVDFQAMSTF